MVNKKIRRNIFGMAVACLFIFNPNVSVIDLLPDFIGYIILTLCVARLADLNETLEEARTAFLRMIWIDAAKLLSLLWVFGMSVTSERTSSILLWSFVFCVLELLFAVPAFTKLFTGLIQLSNFYPSEVIFRRGKKMLSGAQRDKSDTERLRTLTTVFLSVKAVLSFLPELADLTNSMYDEAASGTVSLYQYIGLLRMVAFIPVFVLGIIWLLRIGEYFHRLSKDSAFTDRISEEYETKILPKKGIFVKRNIQTAFIVLIVASILTFDFRLENINFLPDILAATIFLIFFAVIGKYAHGYKKYGMVVSIIYMVTSNLAYTAELYFFKEHSYNAIIRSDEALISFAVMIGFEVLKGIAFVLTIFGVYKVISCVIDEHTGYVLGREHVTEATERQATAVKKELKLPIKLMLAAAIAYAVSDVAYEALIDTLGFMGIINLVFAFLFVVSVLKAQSEISLAVNTKYMLE